jgi:hypothetical protein
MMAVVTLLARNVNEAMAVPMEGSAFGGSLESGSWFCISAFGINLASVTVKIFSNLIYFTKKFYKFYKFCTFNAICKDNAAIKCIKCITVQHKKSSFLSTLMGHTTLVTPY